MREQGESSVLRPLSSHSPAFEAFHLAKSGDGVLAGFSVYNSNAGVQFIQLFDASALPADGAVPEIMFRVSGLTTFGASWGMNGRPFQQGCIVCNSSTAATKTIGAADCFFDVQYA